MNRPIRQAALALLLSGVGRALAQSPAAPAPPAPKQDLVVVLQGNQQALLKLALPAFGRTPGALATAADAARELEQAVRDDLDDSRIFVVQGPTELQPLQLTGDLAHDKEQYRSLGNEVLARCQLGDEPGKITLEASVLDLKSGQSIFHKLYRGDLALARRVAHTFADELVLYFTGKPGIARTSIAFASTRSGSKEIYLMDADGRNQRPITAHRSISRSPAWSPGGEALAYVSFFAGPPAIYLAELASGRKLPVATEGNFNTSPSFAPDGRHVVFARSVAGNSEIFACDVDGKGARQLTHSPGIDTDPAWSPNGRQIAFTSSRSGSPQIYLMDAEGTDVRRVTFDGEYNDGASWRPDGTQIVYSSRHGNFFDLALTDIVSLSSRPLTRGPGSKEHPSFSPDGRRIVYEVNQGGAAQVWVVFADGAQPRVLTSQGDNSSPSWSGYLK